MLYKQEGGQMKKILFIIPLVILLFFTLSCQQAEEPVEEPVIDIEAEKQAVEKATYDFFNAAFAHDYQGIRDLCTEDFLLFESGQVMNVEEFINFIKPFEGSTTTFALENFKVNVNGSVGWISLRNKAVMSMGEQVMNFDWLESGVLKKQDGAWKLAFYHSTTVEPPAEK
jgi:ketosteroid isomerase-like protein